MPDIASRNHFYLGREHDLATGETAAEPLLYKSKDLTTHAVCVGMTGSGKTGLCLSLLEEAALDGVPAICIDPKGDLGNLLLGFPNLQPADFRPWVDESVAQRKGLKPDEFAEKTAALWKNGLADWGQGPERIQQYNDSVERLIFTPGASHGIPMTVLKSFDAPPEGAARRHRRVPRARLVRGVRVARPLGDRRRPGAEPRAHLPVERADHPVEGPQGPVDRGHDPQYPEAAVRIGRRDGPGDLLPREGPHQAGDGPQQPAGEPHVRRLDVGSAAQRAGACCSPPRASRGCRSSRSRT